MKRLPYLCLIVIVLVPSYGEGQEAEGKEEETGNNKVLSGPYNCVRERPGATCPAGEDLYSGGKSNGANKRRPKKCFSSSNPLTRFFLFTPNNTQNAELLDKCGGMLAKNTFFNPRLRTVVLIHGLCDGFCRAAAQREFKDQLFCNGDYNVLAVDWTKDSFPDFYDAINAVPKVAKRVCCVLRNIMRQTGLSRKKLHLIGISAGAHIAGFVGKSIKGIRRLTGLDPLNFGFQDKDCSRRLCRDDACFVDVIHTNMGECVGHDLHVGFPYPIGHIDFYPNGGVTQPSCYTVLPTYFAGLDVIEGLYALVPSFCYHLQAWKFFKASVNPCDCECVGVECTAKDFEDGKCNECKRDGSNCAVMGFNADKYKVAIKPNMTRNFYLKTGLTCPFCDNSGVKLNGFPKNSIKKDPGRHCFDPNSNCHLRGGSHDNND